MRHLILLAALGILSAGMAQKWEYANFSVWTEKNGKRTYFWKTPDMQGVGAFVSEATFTIEDMANKAKCKLIPLGKFTVSEVQLFNCFGMRGWELFHTDKNVLTNLKVTDYWFKRVAK